MVACVCRARGVGGGVVISQEGPGQMRALLQGANADVQVKICGLRTSEHLQTASDAGADMLGLMFYEPSSRYIAPQQAATSKADRGF